MQQTQVDTEHNFSRTRLMNQLIWVILNPMTGVTQHGSKHFLSCLGWIPPSLSSLFSLVAAANYQGLSFCPFVPLNICAAANWWLSRKATKRWDSTPSLSIQLRRSTLLSAVGISTWGAKSAVVPTAKNNNPCFGKTKPVYKSLVCFFSAFGIPPGSTTRGWSMRMKTMVCWKSSALHIWCPARPKPTSPAWFTVMTAQVRSCVC